MELVARMALEGYFSDSENGKHLLCKPNLDFHTFDLWNSGCENYICIFVFQSKDLQSRFCSSHLEGLGCRSVGASLELLQRWLILSRLLASLVFFQAWFIISSLYFPQWGEASPNRPFSFLKFWNSSLWQSNYDLLNQVCPRCTIMIYLFWALYCSLTIYKSKPVTWKKAALVRRVHM